MQVQRIQTDRGSHIEPPLDPRWSDLDKLCWKAAVIEADAGVHVRVYLIEGRYGLQVGRSSLGAVYTYSDAWTLLIGVSLGAQAALGLTHS